MPNISGYNYFCPAFFSYIVYDNHVSFGPQEMQDLLDGCIERVQPISRIQGFLNGLHPHNENRIWGVLSNKQTRKLRRWHSNNLKNLVIYHSPFDLNQCVEGYKHAVKMRELGIPIKMPNFKTEKEYLRALNQTFEEPFLIHYKDYLSICKEPDRLAGHYVEFFVAGEKKYTKDLSNLLLDQPELIEKIIVDLTGIQESQVNGLFKKYKDALIHFDTARKPKKTIKKINW